MIRDYDQHNGQKEVYITFLTLDQANEILQDNFS